VGDDTDLVGWFEENELETCPLCGTKKLVPSDEATAGAQLRVCLTCGIVPEPRADA
jgi:hypothetical protein